MGAPKGNKYALGNKGGRPPKYTNSRKLAKRIEEYFTYCLGEFHEEMQETIEGRGKYKKSVMVSVRICDREPERPTWTGIALFLGFESRQSLTDYSKDNEFSYSIKRARLVIENLYEEALMMNGPSGAIFALKNMDWKDKVETEHSGSIAVPITGMEIK